MRDKDKTTTTTRTSTQSSRGRVVSADQIPDKRYFRIGEVAELLGVKSHVLRYWQKEFPQLNPQKSRAGQRMYRRRDVEILLHIRALLYERGYTISGAAKLLKSGIKNLPPLGTTPQPEQNSEAVQAASSSNAQAISNSTAGLPRDVVPGAGSQLPDQAGERLPTAAYKAEQLALALQKDPLHSRKKEVVRALNALIRLCDEADAEDIDPFTQQRQDRQQASNEPVVVVSSRRHT